MADIEEIKKFLIEIKPEDITAKLIESKFCNHYDPETGKLVKPEVDFQTEFILKKGEYLNKEDVKTNVGQFIVNKVLFGSCPKMQKVLGYVAKPFNKKVIEENETKLAQALMEEQIDTKEYKIYLNNIQWLGFTFNAHVSSSFTPKSTKILPSVLKRKKELYKQYEKEIASGDVVTYTKINDELLDMSKDELKNDVGMIIYDSGCKPKFGANYGVCFVAKSPSYNFADGTVDIPENSNSEGMTKNEIVAVGNSIIAGAYPKAVGTKVAGYETKKLFTCYQTVQMDRKGSDCKSKYYRTLLVTNKNFNAILNRYFLDGNKLTKITSEIKSKVIGKTIKLRSPLYCCGDKLCNMCAGDAPYIMNIENIGLVTSNIGGALLNFGMKGFHDSTIKTYDVDIDRMFL